MDMMQSDRAATLSEPEPTPSRNVSACESPMDAGSHIAQVQELSMREMRERMEGEEVLRLQEGLVRVTGRVDEALIELRSEMPRIRQEIATKTTELEKVDLVQNQILARVDALERGLAEETAARYGAEKSQTQDMRESVAAEVQRLNSAIVETRG